MLEPAKERRLPNSVKTLHGQRLGRSADVDQRAVEAQQREVGVDVDRRAHRVDDEVEACSRSSLKVAGSLVA